MDRIVRVSRECVRLNSHGVLTKFSLTSFPEIRISLQTNRPMELQAMRNLDRKGILWIVSLWLAAVGIFLYGVLAHAQTPPKPGLPDEGGMRRVAIEGTVRHVF